MCRHVRYWLDTFQEDPFAINLSRDFSLENIKAELSDGTPPPAKAESTVESTTESKTEAVSPNIFNQEEKALYGEFLHVFPLCWIGV